LYAFDSDRSAPDLMKKVEHAEAKPVRAEELRSMASAALKLIQNYCPKAQL